MSERRLRPLRTQIGMIFQQFNLFNSKTVSANIAYPLKLDGMPKDRIAAKVTELLDFVGLADKADAYPDQLSGGQKQRVGIARALATRPEILLCDEATSALDVSIQAQIINLMQDLQQNIGLTYLFIAHDLSMVRHLSHRIAVMYLGSLVELADSASLFKQPQHPYSQALLSAIPLPDPKVEATRERIFMPGEVPSPINPPSGCRFRTRCRHAMPICAENTPQLLDDGTGHHTACHLVHPAD